MLEFAREQWLWLFLLLALFYAAWIIARRYRKRRVTYGAVWMRVARRVTPPSWRRLLRQALTLLVATAMLSSVVLYAAGLQRSPDQLPAPLLLIIVQDNSVSMRARHGDTTRREMANARARELLRDLREDDRAVLASFKFGQPLLGPWLSAGAVAELPPTDFAEPDLRALAEAVHALGVPPDVPPRPAPRKLVIWLGDVAPTFPEEADLYVETGPAIAGRAGRGVPVHVQTFGEPAANDAIVAARFVPPQPGDEHGGIVEAQTLSGAEPRVMVAGQEQRGNRVILPVSAEGQRVEVRTAGGDALPEDDAVAFNTLAPAIRSVALCYPADDGEPNPFLLELLRLRLPGREISALAMPAPRVEADLIVADRALPESYDARALLLFGVGGEAGVIGAPVNASLRAPVETPDVGLDVPDLTLIAARQAIPLTETTLTPLTRHIEGGVLIGIQRQPREILYSGFIPHRSTLLESPDGLLLLVRWLEAVSALPPPLIPPLVAAGEMLTLQLPGPAKIHPAPDSGWPEAHFEPGWHVTPGPDGKAQWQAPEQPGRWILATEHGAQAEFQIVWSSDRQRLSFLPIDTPALRPPPRQAHWSNLLPALLLWIALGLLALEWLLWAAGALE
jgi:hypothetical protein